MESTPHVFIYESHNLGVIMNGAASMQLDREDRYVNCGFFVAIGTNMMEKYLTAKKEERVQHHLLQRSCSFNYPLASRCLA